MFHDPKPETVPGPFIEHFDVAPGRITQPTVLAAAREVAAEKGWGFRSYSSGEWWATNDDFVARRIVSFPTLVLFVDGAEADRITMNQMSLFFISKWAEGRLARKMAEDLEALSDTTL